MISATSAPSGTDPRARIDAQSPACICGASSGRRAGGFTLVELLVVIGIIVLLIGILLPVISRAMRQATRNRIASDLNAIASALEAYKGDFGDYPRIIYTTTTPFNGTGSGASVLGKALLGLGDATSAAYSASTAYSSGQIVNYSGNDYGAIANVPANGTNTTPGTSGSIYWALIPLSTAADGNDGPGFRIRNLGKVYGPYLQPDKFKTIGLAIADSFGNPILYYPANPSHPVVTIDGTTLKQPDVFGAGNSYVGTAAGVSPNSNPSAPTGPCQSLYNYSDNDTDSLNIANSGAFIPAFPDIVVMEAMLGNYDFNTYKGYIGPGETPASTASFLLWSAGPDGEYGPVNNNSSSLASFQTLGPTGVKNLVNACDDVTNFTFAQ